MSDNTAAFTLGPVAIRRPRGGGAGGVEDDLPHGGLPRDPLRPRPSPPQHRGIDVDRERHRHEEKGKRASVRDSPLRRGMRRPLTCGEARRSAITGDRWTPINSDRRRGGAVNHRRGQWGDRWPQPAGRRHGGRRNGAGPPGNYPLPLITPRCERQANNTYNRTRHPHVRSRQSCRSKVGWKRRKTRSRDNLISQ